ncbi:DUF4936 family protein [Herbaspirillum lusitanum]|uniref:DUF4936 family protein n=1 Tax=Herbaspirillum lusitanum TaxID=213312 RepID=A0ABW9AAT9_9BURK
MDLYIYYKVAGTRIAALQDKVENMQAVLRARHGIQTALKRRPEEVDGMQTWMEVYMAAPQGFEAELVEASQAAGLPALIDGQRHVERFMDVASCA